ncbi:serine/threonine-protein kinase [Anatilimnocola sp. NA78]|uniref:serine/threonine-protein kinase n=1 Tax=Anatilimnocola sp. NA78 TaxID=3415683 RepID=UPI003CE4E415
MKNADEQLMTIFSAALDCETNAARAAYLDNACGASPDLRQRVEALLRAHNRSVDFLKEPATEQAVTAAFKPASLPGGINSSGRAFQEELRQLLRSRLILAHLLLLSFVVLMQLLSFASPFGDNVPSHRPDNGVWWRFAPPFVVALIGVLALWRWDGMSLRSLRVWEIICFASQAMFYGYDRFERLAYPDSIVEVSPITAIGFQGLATLQGFSILILAYGVLIPNTRRRSLIVVVAFAVIAIAALLSAVVINPMLLRDGHVLPLVVQEALTLMFPSAIAVFAATRASALQKRAFDAERRAERMGQYTLKRKLGEGGMGEVWLAEHELLKRPCAVKFIRRELAADPSNASRFTREVQAVTGLSHVNTVRVYDYGQADDGSFYFVMEYLDGPTLEELVKASGPVPARRAVHLLRQICGALAEAHAAGLVHRDLKPSNVIVTTLGGQPDVTKLLDFGLVHDSSDNDQRLTRMGMVLGTPAYMCPEQAAGDSAIDARGDIYSFGALAFFTLTGRPPFQAKTTGQLLAAHLSQPPPFLTEFCHKAPGGLAALIARCLSKEPADRFQSTVDVIHALDECV